MLKLFRFLPFLSLMLVQACQHSTEIKAGQTALAQKHQAASYNTQLGLAYLKQGDMPRAKRKLLAALDLEPDSADAYVAMAYYLEKTGDMKKARMFYQKALSLAPNSGAQLNNYGAFLCRLGKYNEAESYFLKAVSDVRYIHTAGAYENAGLCATVIPEYSKAKKYFAKALEQDPQRKQSLYELVTIELKQNHANKALMYLQKYPVLSLNDPVLLDLAINAAHQAGKARVELDYQQRLSRLNNFTDHTGAKNEYDSNNG